MLHILEFFIDNSNEDIDKNERTDEQEEHPKQVAQYASIFAIVHDSVPWLAGGGSKQRHHRLVKTEEISMWVDKAQFTFFNLTE